MNGTDEPAAANPVTAPAAAADPVTAPAAEGEAVTAPAAAADPVTASAADGEAAAAATGARAGHPAVDEALAALTDVGSRPPDEQIRVYETVHRTLQETLGSIEQT